MKKLIVLLGTLATLWLSSPTTALAVSLPPECVSGDQYQLGVPLGEILKAVPKNEQAFRCYVIGFYWYVIGLAVILASIVVTWAGYVWLTSGGDPGKIQHARELIIGALSGLALLLLAATVLRLIGIGT